MKPAEGDVEVPHQVRPADALRNHESRLGRPAEHLPRRARGISSIAGHAHVVATVVQHVKTLHATRRRADVNRVLGAQHSQRQLPQVRGDVHHPVADVRLRVRVTDPVAELPDPRRILRQQRVPLGRLTGLGTGQARKQAGVQSSTLRGRIGRVRPVSRVALLQRLSDRLPHLPHRRLTALPAEVIPHLLQVITDCQPQRVEEAISVVEHVKPPLRIASQPLPVRPVPGERGDRLRLVPAPRHQIRHLHPAHRRRRSSQPRIVFQDRALLRRPRRGGPGATERCFTRPYAWPSRGLFWPRGRTYRNAGGRPRRRDLGISARVD